MGERQFNININTSLSLPPFLHRKGGGLYVLNATDSTFDPHKKFNTSHMMHCGMASVRVNPNAKPLHFFPPFQISLFFSFSLFLIKFFLISNYHQTKCLDSHVANLHTLNQAFVKGIT